MSTREKLYTHISQNGLGNYLGEELRKLVEADDWARVLRQLRQDGVLEFEYDRKNKHYTVNKINDFSVTTKRSGLTSKDKYRIRNRDGHRCQSCGKGVNDGIKLHIDHKIPLEWGGINLDSNLWTLCQECNLAKKSFFKDDFDPELMKLVFKEDSGYQRLKVLFENAPGKKFTPSILQGIAGIRDWPRTIRSIRQKHKLNITWFEPDSENPNGYYSNV